MRAHILIVVVAIGVRLALPLSALVVHGDPEVFVQADTNSYVRPARMLVERGRFESPGGRPETLRTPGYPLLLTIGVLADRLIATTIVVQILLGAGTVFVVALLARRWTPQAAVWAAAFYALDPLSVFYVSTLLTETLFTAVFVAHLYALVRVLEGPQRLAWSTAAGVLAAAATFVRPIAYYWPFVAVAILLWVLRRGGVRVGAVLLVSALLPCALWQARNFDLTGRAAFSTIGAWNLYIYSSAAVLARVENAPTEMISERFRAEVEHLEPTQRNEHARRMAARILTEHPLTFLHTHLSGMVQVIVGRGFSGWVQLYGGQNFDVRGTWPYGVYLMFVGILALQLGCAVVGILRGWSRNSAVTLILLGAAAYFLLLSGGPIGTSRFRVPIMPLVCVFAGVAVSLQRTGEGRRSLVD